MNKLIRLKPFDEINIKMALKEEDKNKKEENDKNIKEEEEKNIKEEEEKRKKDEEEKRKKEEEEKRKKEEEEEKERIENEKRIEIEFHNEINSIINPENKISKLNKELKELNEEKRTIEEIIYYKELDKNIIYQIILKNNNNSLEIHINNYNDKPFSSYFSSFSLEILQKNNNYFRLFNNINSFLFEIKELIDNSFLYLDSPKNESESIFLNIPLNILIIDNIQFQVKKKEKELLEINKDLIKYNEILEKEKENCIKIIKKLNKICFENEDCINDINNDLSKKINIIESKTKMLKDIKEEKNNIIDDIQKYIEKTNQLNDLKKNEYEKFNDKINEIQNSIELYLKNKKNDNSKSINNDSINEKDKNDEDVENEEKDEEEEENEITENI